MRILSTKQTAERLGVSPRKIRTMISEGKIIAQKLENEYAILDTDILTIEEHNNLKAQEMQKIIDKFGGCLNSGLTDLSTNKKYMEGFGENKRG